MRHYRIPVAIAVGLATAIAAGGTGVAKTTPAAAAKPAARDEGRQADGRPPRRHAQAAGEGRRRLARPADQLHARSTGSSTARTHDGLVTFKAAGGDAAFEIVPDLAVAIPKPTERRQDLDLQAAQGHQVLQRQDRAAARTWSSTFQRIFKVSQPDRRRLLQRHRRRRQVPQDAGHLHSRRRSWSTTKANTVTFHLDAARRRVARQARRAACRDPAVRHAHQGSRHQAAARHRRLHVHEVRPEPRAR